MPSLSRKIWSLPAGRAPSTRPTPAVDCFFTLSDNSVTVRCDGKTTELDIIDLNHCLDLRLLNLKTNHYALSPSLEALKSSLVGIHRGVSLEMVEGHIAALKAMEAKSKEMKCALKQLHSQVLSELFPTPDDLVSLLKMHDTPDPARSQNSTRHQMMPGDMRTSEQKAVFQILNFYLIQVRKGYDRRHQKERMFKPAKPLTALQTVTWTDLVDAIDRLKPFDRDASVLTPGFLSTVQYLRDIRTAARLESHFTSKTMVKLQSDLLDKWISYLYAIMIPVTSHLRKAKFATSGETAELIRVGWSERLEKHYGQLLPLETRRKYVLSLITRLATVVEANSGYLFGRVGPEEVHSLSKMMCEFVSFRQLVKAYRDCGLVGDADGEKGPDDVRPIFGQAERLHDALFPLLEVPRCDP